MAKVLVFPQIGSVREAPVYAAPVRGEDEDDADWARRTERYAPREAITARVKIVTRREALAWQQRIASAMAQDEAARARGETVAPQGVAESLVVSMLDTYREIVAAGLVGLSGIGLDDGAGKITPIDTLTGTALVDAVDGCDLMLDIALAVLRAQSLSPRQAEL